MMDQIYSIRNEGSNLRLNSTHSRYRHTVHSSLKLVTVIRKIIWLFIYVFVVVSLSSCNNEWDKHYKIDKTVSDGLSIAEYIHSQPELSKFYSMLIISGYDTVLNKMQNYTVWASDNQSLSDVDLSDITNVKDIVKNQITLFSFPTYMVNNSSTYVKNVNDKYILFEHSGNGFEFGQKLLIANDYLASNGLVHVLNGYLPYFPNVYEFIQRNPGFSSLNSYISSFRDSTLNESSSYDSTYTYKNYLFDIIGQLNKETTNTDSMFTVILPNDTAWKNAYLKIKDYFISAHATRAQEIQETYTNYSIVSNLVFRGKDVDPYTSDYLFSTTGSIFKEPGYLFANSYKNNVSNGYVYVTDTFRYKASESWAKSIKIEAEATKYGRISNNCDVLNRFYYGSDFDVSNNQYVLINPTTTSTLSKVWVKFPIPNTLSARYNIYCVFVPNYLEDNTDKRPFKALFYITYIGEDRLQAKDQQLVVPNNVSDSTHITKMLIASNFKFPFSHISTLEKSEDIVTIRVQTDVKAGPVPEKANSRSMRIDYLLLEPVDE